MEDIIFFMFCLLSIININIKGYNNFFYDYMELENTSPIKGIFVWIIIFSHNKKYYKTKYKDKLIYIKILRYLGQKMVSLFLFYSGYGISESIKKNGLNYVKTLPKKAIILFIKFQLILLIFLINNVICGIKIKVKQYILSIIFKSCLGNSNWFAFTIICLYFCCYLSYIFIKSKKYIMIGNIILTIICFFYGYLVYNFFYPNKNYAVDNIFSFLIGLYFSLLKTYLNKIIFKSDIFYFGNISIFILIYYYLLTSTKNIFIISTINAIFCLIIILISMKVRFNNEFLKLLNEHSYSIYLLQRVVMIFVSHKKLFINNEIIRFFFIFIMILFLASIFDKYTLFINKLLGRRVKKINKNIISSYKSESLEFDEKLKILT